MREHVRCNQKYANAVLHHAEEFPEANKSTPPEKKERFCFSLLS